MGNRGNINNRGTMGNEGNKGNRGIMSYGGNKGNKVTEVKQVTWEARVSEVS